jgi:hypothetical protein
MRQTRGYKWVFLVALVGFIPLLGLAATPPPPPTVTFRPVGVIEPLSPGSTVVDATRVGTQIRLVGGTGWPNGDGQRSTLWTSTAWDANAPLVPTKLPNAPNYPGGTAATSATAITPDGAYIASQARSANGPVAVRVRVSDLLTTDLFVAPYSQLGGSPRSGRSISDDGSILYGIVTLSGANRAVRYDTVFGTSTLIPLLPGTTSGNIASRQATSSNGTIMAGTSFTNPFSNSTGGHAYRYVHGAPVPVSAIPELTGGTWSKALALSSNGNLVLVAGNSTHFPNGQMNVYNAALNTTTSLGSPNTAWVPGNLAGMSDDGSVVALNFTPPAGGVGNSYIHNAQGWFHLTTILAAASVNPNWDSLQINSISNDGTLLVGQGRHNDIQEGFVAEFPDGYLAGFDAPAVAPTDTSIVGAWFMPDPTPDNNPAIFIFAADGTYYEIEANAPASEPSGANGFERGTYTWNGATSELRIVTRQDSDGDAGISGLNGVHGFTYTVVGDNAVATLPPGQCDGPPCSFPATRVTGAPGTIVGGWYGGDARVDDSSVVVLFLANGDYYFAQDGEADPGGHDGIEKGTWAWNAATGDLVATTSVDTNGEWGLSHAAGLITLQLSPDGFRMNGTEGSESFTFNRVAVAAAPTETGANVIVAPISPAGTTPVTIQFDTVSGAGSTTVQVIDPAASGSPAPPDGFTLGDPPLYYEIHTTASFSGPLSVCFNYGGISFGAGTPRLFHFEAGAWTDITTSVDTATSTICGSTTSFSPFAIFVSPVIRTGFYSPVSQVAGFVNTAKGGSTVPLKFNVFVNGVEKTDTGGLDFSVSSVACSASAPEDAVDFTTTAATILRYDADGGYFIQNWKTPKTPGCYVVRMTTAADGLSISALFKIK